MSLRLKQQSSSGPFLPLQPIHPPPSSPSNLKCSDLAAAPCSKGNKEANLLGRKVCFVLDVSIVQRLTLPAYSQEARAFIDRGRQLHAKNSTVSFWQSSWNWSLVVLTSITVTVLSTVSLQFQHRFVSSFWGQFSERWQLISWLHKSGHHGVNFLHLLLSIYETAHRIWLTVLSIALEKELKVLVYA